MSNKWPAFFQPSVLQLCPPRHFGLGTVSEDFPPGMADAAQVSVVKKVQLDEVLARYEGFGEVRLQSPNFVGLFVFLKQTEKHLVEWTVVRHCAIMWWHASVTFAEFFAKLATHRDENPSIELDLQSFTLWYKLDDFAGWGCNFYLLIFEQKECVGFPSQRW